MSVDLTNLQALTKTLNDLASALSSALNTDTTSLPNIDKIINSDDTGTDDTKDLIDKYLKEAEEESKKTQQAVQQAPAHRTYEYIHRYVYERPSEKFWMPAYIAQEILMLADQALLQANSVMKVLPQVTGSPLDFNRWVQGLDRLTGIVLNLLPVLKDAWKTLTVKDFDGQSPASEAGKNFDGQSFAVGE